MPLVTPDPIERTLQQANMKIQRLKLVKGPNRRPLQEFQDAADTLTDLAACVRDLNQRLKAIETAR